MNTQESIDRLEAFVRFDNDANAPAADCEDCGAAIPVELTKCSDCEGR